MLEEFIKERFENSKKSLDESELEGLNEDGSLDIWFFSGKSYSDFSIGMLETCFWHNLGVDTYWRALSDLEVIYKKSPNFFSSDDLIKIKSIMVEQLIEGKEVASNTPLYSDMWVKFKADNSPIKDFITEEDIGRAVNDGFFHSLIETGNDSNRLFGNRELSRILEYENFFDVFDFNKGVERSLNLNDGLIFSGDEDFIQDYFLWYSIQERVIDKKLDYETGLVAKGKALSPLIRTILYTNNDEFGDEKLKKLMNYVIDGNLYRTPLLQDVFGEVFEYSLDLGFKGEYYEFPGWAFHISEKNLVDKEQHVRTAWKKNKEDISLDKVVDEVKKYVPKESIQGHVEYLQNKIKDMKRLDMELYDKWKSLDENLQVSSKVKKEGIKDMFDVYTDQKVRPSKDTISLLSYDVEKRKSQKIDAYLFADMVSKDLIKKANDMLREYNDNGTPTQIKVFHEKLEEYVGEHGPIFVKKWNLNENHVYPYINLVANLADESKDLFKIK
ncbi:hypothetical protein C0585_01355 [Candidatus Woesearchaeota archaeon]|nr:MAG: hypothetical protein C0585_01355 [Candidatus Woesearchaeota archaeon]